jgi:phosphatidate cytidylyltransferase
VKELTKRIYVAVWGIPALLVLSYLGGYYFLALILIINMMALWEFYSIFRKKEIYAYRILGIITSSILILFTFFNALLSAIFLLMFATIIIIFMLQLRPQKNNPILNSALTMQGLFYISSFLVTLLYFRIHFLDWFPEAAVTDPYLGGRFLIVLWASIWICDTAAYSGGRKLGKHKLAPNVSPNKTVEGGVFGLVFGIIAFVALGKISTPIIDIKYLLISGLIVGIFGQLGDLVESRFKRIAGVKDTSTLLPGHGGFFDRFDSIIFVSPFLLALFSFFRF